MAKNGKPSENKVHAPKVEKRGAKTKHRKGGDKARKLEPTKRLAKVMAKFTGTTAELNQHRHNEEERIKDLVALGVREPMSGYDFQYTLHRPRHKTVNPKKVAKLLMPNGY